MVQPLTWPHGFLPPGICALMESPLVCGLNFLAHFFKFVKNLNLFIFGCSESSLLLASFL